MQMKKGIKALFVLLLLILYTFGALAAEKANKPQIKTVENYIAVFDFEVTTGDKGISRPLADKVIHEFSMSDKYEVIDRGNMNKVLKEQKFQMTGCVAQECKVEAGQILGVGKIVNGSVGIVGKTYYLTLQLIDVKTGKVELSAEDECRCEIDELLGSTKRLAKKLLGEKFEQLGELATRAKAEEERIKAEQAARAKAEEERIKAEMAAKAKLEEERIKAEKATRAKAEEERIKAEQAARAKAEEERIKAEKAARAKAEEGRIKAEQAASAKAEEERIKAEMAAKARLEEERIKAEQAARDRAEEQKLKAEQAARAKAEEERIKAEKAARTEAEDKQHVLKTVIAEVAPPAVSSTITASDVRFEKFASGVVRDKKNGLDWYAGPDRDTYWDDAKSWAASLRVDGGGWRMPTSEELKILYRKGAGSRNMTPLLETTGWLILSGETAGPGGVWVIDLGDGRGLLTGRGYSVNKRGFAVRSTPKPSTKEIDTAMVSATIIASNDRFEKLANGVVRDTKSDLEWYAGQDKDTVWDDAKQWTAGLRVDGGGWRMPTIAELKGLYRKGAGSRNITPLLETTGWWVWSGEWQGGNVGWPALDFDDGRELLDRRDNSFSKRGFAVRSRK